MRSDEIHPGDVIAGKYRVRAILSRSPTLQVEAFHVEFDQRVVIKLLLPGTGDDKEIERFRREARVLSKLESEHAARIIDVGTQPDGAFYLVRQHVEGEDLATYVQSYGPRPLTEAVLLVLQAAECVAETHAQGIIVRELSPANITVARRASGTPIVKLTDFGTAKLMRDASAPAGNSSLTATALFGLSAYSSPEMVRKAKNVDVRTDVYSLGAVLYFLLAGRPPFAGDVARLMLAITREEAPKLTSLRGDLPREIDDIIGWSLAKEVDRRFKNVHAFAHALGPFAPSEGRVLVERIGQIAHASKRQGAAPIPSYAPPPPSMPGGYGGATISAAGLNAVEISSSSLEEDDVDASIEEEATVILGGAGSDKLRQQAVAIARSVGRPIDIPPAPPSLPPSPWLPNSPRIVPPAISQPRLPAMEPPPSMRSAQPPSPPPAFARHDTVPPPSTHSHAPPKPAPKKGGFDMRILWGALAATAVMLPVVLLLLVRDAPRAQPLAEVPAREPAGAAATPTQPTPPPTAEPGAVVLGDPAAAPTATAEPAAQPTATAEPSVTAQPVAAVDPSPPATAQQPSGYQPRPAATPAPAPTPKPAPTPTPAPTPKPAPTPTAKEPEPAAGGGSGRLLAIASGGSCSFSVNGGSKGSGSSLSLSLPAGKYTVVCKPSSGSTKSRAVTIKPNETSMLTFKL